MLWARGARTSEIACPASFHKVLSGFAESGISPGKLGMRELLFFLEALLISFLMTGAILRYSLRRSLLDIPTDRGSHEVPKPRLGGVAIVLTFYLTILTPPGSPVSIPFRASI